MSRDRILFETERQTANYPDETRIIAMSVVIQTGTKSHAGTDANVRFSVAGAGYNLDKPGYDDFEKGDKDEYGLGTYPTLTLGRIRNFYIGLRHDNRGKHSGWQVSRIDLKLIEARSNRFITYKIWNNVGWLATDESPNELGITLQLPPEPIEEEPSEHLPQSVGIPTGLASNIQSARVQVNKIGSLKMELRRITREMETLEQEFKALSP